MTAARRFARTALLVLGTGYILAFFSETVFWSVWRPIDEVHGRVLAWLLYSLFAYLTLAVIRHYRLHDAWALLLAGAFFGWVCEGVYAMTVFGHPSMPFPLTIVWTALAWHAPLSLLVGWYALGLALRSARLGPALGLSLGIGAFWGAWALGWRSETPPVAATPPEFLLHAAVTTAGLALAHMAVAAGRPADFAPSRIGLGLGAGVVLAFFAVVTVPTVPFAPLVLPPLIALLWFALRRWRALRPEGSLLAGFAAPVRPGNLATLAVMPVVATSVYAAGGSTLPEFGFVFPLFAAITSVAGLVVFIRALVRVMRRP